MEWCGPGAANTCQFGQFRNQLGLEVSSLIGMELGGQPKSGEKVIIEGRHTCGRFLVR